MKYIFTLKDRLTGEIKEYVSNYKYSIKDLLYQWLEGNFECDCNRALFFWNWEKELPCNTSKENRRIDLLQIRKQKSGKVIYEQEIQD